MPDFTRQEIYSQPAVWQAAIDLLTPQLEAASHLYTQGRYDQVLFTGCGSTYYLSLAAASLYRQLTGQPARGLPASELWLNPISSYPAHQRILLVAVSRSGETSETLHACRDFLASGRGDLLTISCYPQQPLASLGSLNLVFPASQERSVVQTRSFSSMYLAAVAVIARWARRDDLLAVINGLPGAGQRLLDRHATRAGEIGHNPGIDRYYFLGSGSRYGLACELSLKMKESTLSHSEPFHFLEFRHGPMSMVTPSTLLVGLRSEANRAAETAVLNEMCARGAHLLVLDEVETDFPFASGLPEPLRGALYLPLGHVLAFEHALAKGLDPDRPHNLEAVVKLP